MTIYLIIAGIAAVLILSGLIFRIRVKIFRPNPDKSAQLSQLNNDLKAAGFAYDYKGDYFYALRDCWQRETGYCRLYDEGTPFFNMIIDCEPVTFSYGGKRWLIELWKGQYGITTGAEIGVYNTTREDIHSAKFTGPFYDAASDAEQLDIAFALLKNGRKILKRRARHWWLTAFKLGEFSETDTLTLHAKIKFPTTEMCRVFTDALIDTGYSRGEFSVKHRTVMIRFTTPHSPQPLSRKSVQSDAAQLLNRKNCEVYRLSTAKYTDSLDRLEYLKAFVPELYEFMLKSLYGKEFFKKFEWLLRLIRGNKQPDPPQPPVLPEPPCRPPCCCECYGGSVRRRYFFNIRDTDET